MISFFTRILLFYSLYFTLEQMGYVLNIGWFVIGACLVECLITSWNQWQRTRLTNNNPELSLRALTALIRIRSAEIGAIYNCVREYQKKAKDTNWVSQFIAEYRYHASRGLYNEPISEKEQKYLIKAYALFKKRFDYNNFFGTLDDPELMDITFGVHNWSTSIDLTIRLLNSIPCDANICRYVCALVREYRLVQFLSLNGNYHILFKNFKIISPLVRERYCKLQKYWKEVISSHQTAIIIAKASNLTQQEISLLDDIWKENELLIERERNLQRAISQANSESYGWEWDWKKESSFFQRLKTNPIWAAFYNYDPYTNQNNE